jgi:hypothetical protein
MVMISAKKMLSNATALAELEAIRQQTGGILKAEDVVNTASSLTSPLHDYFEWDDTRAADEFRLQQARMLIRSVVVIIPKHSEPVAAYVSLREDRIQDGGGYRTVIDVMSDDKLRERLLLEALADLEHWQRKYDALIELQPVFDSITKMIKRKVGLAVKVRRRVGKAV